MVVKRLRHWFGRIRRLPARWAIPLAVLVVAAASVGGVFAYRSYNYVQHDNDFCLSCHLMQDPYERFSRSDHRGLGCKACHQPTPVVRANMALTQVLQQPDSLTVHAQVPNQRCIDCHVNGDPDEWRLISSSVGHRIHLESKDPELQDLNCVECHSTSVHEFAATSRTCAQSGCHETTEITLGKMGNLTMHCIACHDFSRPVRTDLPADSLRIALQPDREQCLSCHQMRVLVSDMPENEPHNAACALCHDPHKQSTPAEAVQSCAGSGCHEAVDTLSPLHRGLPPGVLQTCTRCHPAHQFRIGNKQCIDCHRDIFTRPSPRRWSSASAGPTLLAEVARARSPFTHEARTVRLASSRVMPQQQPSPGQTGSGVPFEHSRHQTVDCSACHSSATAHGTLKITSFRDCQTCHHAAPAAPATASAASCTRCHADAEFRAQSYPTTLTLEISAGDARRQRQARFVHSEHGTFTCVQCHTDPVTRSAVRLDCESCHTQHHEPVRECRACHAPAPTGAHDLRVHEGCAQCHERSPVSGVPRTREFCLVCHQTLVQHRPGGNCAQCHIMPAPRTTGRASGAG